MGSHDCNVCLFLLSPPVFSPILSSFFFVLLCRGGEAFDQKSVLSYSLGDYLRPRLREMKSGPSAKERKRWRKTKEIGREEVAPVRAEFDSPIASDHENLQDGDDGPISEDFSSSASAA